MNMKTRLARKLAAGAAAFLVAPHSGAGPFPCWESVVDSNTGSIQPGNHINVVCGFSAGSCSLLYGECKVIVADDPPVPESVYACVAYSYQTGTTCDCETVTVNETVYMAIPFCAGSYACTDGCVDWTTDPCSDSGSYSDCILNPC